ncbi:MAG: hypothetical protein GWO04_35625 [Actinobacteria bacterium]|nr:hypothetical protein [Actinomycetota bacterium]
MTDDDGEPWVGTPRGLGHFDGDSWRHLFHNARMGRGGLQDNLIEALDRDPAGGLWVGHGESETIAEGGGLGHYDGARWHYYDERDGLPSNRVLRVRADRPDEVWVGTTRGAARLRDQRFTTFHSEGGLDSNNVLQIAAGDAGRVVVLTTGSLALFERGVRSELPEAPFANPRTVAWHDGLLWVGAADGLWLLDDGRWRRDTSFPPTPVVGVVSADDRLWVADALGIRSASHGHWRPERVGDPGVHRIFVGRRGSLWLSADGKRPGLTGLQSGRPYVIDVPRAVARARVAFAPDGSTWLVTTDGIAQWSPDGSSPLQMPPGVEPRSVAWDADGRMWIGTRRSGLWRLEGPEWTAVQLHGRPFPHEIVELALESDGALWVGTAAEGAFRIALGDPR